MVINKNISNVITILNILKNSNKIVDLENIFIEKIAIPVVKENKTILIAGNGGSASQADHFVGEIIGRYYRDRIAKPAICLNSQIATLTALANDYGYDYVFSKQIEAYKDNACCFIALSTSGNSSNLIEAVNEAKKYGIFTLSLLGKDGGKLNNICDFSIVVPSNDTPTIQNVHILILHSLAEVIESAIIENP